MDPTSQSHPIAHLIHLYFDVPYKERVQIRIHVYIWVSFAEEPSKRDGFLQKRPINSASRYEFICPVARLNTHSFALFIRRIEIQMNEMCYGVALASRIDKIIGLFCKRSL